MDKLETSGRMAQLAHIPLSVFKHDLTFVKNFCENDNILTIEMMGDKAVKQCFSRIEERTFDFQHLDFGLWVGVINDPDYLIAAGPLLSQKKPESLPNGEKVMRLSWQYIQQYDAFTPKLETEEAHKAFRAVYETITNKDFLVQDLWKQQDEDGGKTNHIKKKVDDFLFDQWETQRKHHSYPQEKHQMEQIRNGNVDQIRKVLNESMGGNYGILAKDPLRAAKNIGITSITLYTRAAADGGLNFELALTLSDAYIWQIEDATSIAEVDRIRYAAAEDFTRRVHSHKNVNQIHLLIDQCQDLIFSKMHSKISVQELAKELKVNPDYLSRLFHERMGMTIVEFIQQEKVKLAKNMLIYSQYSLEEIAYYLGFSSQSHFGKVFKQVTDVSPGYYRKTFHASSFDGGPVDK